MGQEISQPSYSQSQSHSHTHSHNLSTNNNNNHANNSNAKRAPTVQPPQPPQLPKSFKTDLFHNNICERKEPVYSSSSVSTSSSTDDEHYRHRQKYNLPDQSYEKTKVAKKLSILSHTTTTTTTTNSSSNFGYQSSSTEDPNYAQLTNHQRNKHQRHSSASTNSSVLYSSRHCISSASLASSAASTASTTSTSVLSTKSNKSNRSSKSLDKQKNYLNHHLYIKSYLDILEEDEKARAQFKSARPGGIRNYTPKILAEASIPIVSGAGGGHILAAKQRQKITEDPWI